MTAKAFNIFAVLMVPVLIVNFLTTTNMEYLRVCSIFLLVMSVVPSAVRVFWTKSKP